MASKSSRKAWAIAWLGMLAIAFSNGVLHRSYEKAVGEHRAQQASSVLLLFLLAPWVWRTERRHPLPTGSGAVRIGLLWAAATVTFEFVFGHYVNRDSWAELLKAYDVRKGRLWLFDVIGIAAAPALARAWRLHSHE
jgi:hypothetical protein